LGDVLVVEALPNPEWIPTRLVYYVGGKLDFGIANVRSLASSHYARPFEVLVDKDDVASTLIAAAAEETTPIQKRTSSKSFTGSGRKP
jgi:aminoglycoside 6-adenylyltransferase